MVCLGRNGAALAAFGEIVVLAGLKLTLASLGDKNEGVKLGESTLRDFFCWLVHQVNHYVFKSRLDESYLSAAEPSAEGGFSTLWLKAHPEHTQLLQPIN